MRRSRGRKIGGSSDGSEAKDWRKNAERAGWCARVERANDFHSKKTRSSESAGRFVASRRDSIPEGDLRLKLAKRKRDGESSPHRDLRHKIRKQQCCAFPEEESCKCRRFSHGLVEGEHSRRKQNNQDRLGEIGGEFIYLRDKTCTVETLDLEQHFSRDRDAAKVKFVGKRGGVNIFKVVVTATWQPNQMRSFYTIRGVELEVESKIQREYTDSNLDKSRSGGRLQREAEGSHGRGKTGWWKTHFVEERGAREDREVKEANAAKKEDRQPHHRSGMRDLQDVELEFARHVVEDSSPCTRKTPSSSNMAEDLQR